MSTAVHFLTFKWADIFAHLDMIKPDEFYSSGLVLITVCFDCLWYEFSGAGCVFIDVGFEALVSDLHLAETCKDLVGAGVVVFGDVNL